MAGQPGYDKDKHKLKIGDGEKYWTELPYASGLFEEDVFNSETKARVRHALDPEDTTIITYGTQSPDKNTVGKVYLQYYETSPEVDYVIDFGIDGIWMYRKWNSGRAECFGTLEISTAIQNPFENNILFYNNTDMTKKRYPFSFKGIPHESATLQSTGNIAWLAGKSMNTKQSSGEYYIVSPYKSDNAKYKIVLHVSGNWK
jgi:hypothetical protein